MHLPEQCVPIVHKAVTHCINSSSNGRHTLPHIVLLRIAKVAGMVSRERIEGAHQTPSLHELLCGSARQTADVRADVRHTKQIEVENVHDGLTQINPITATVAYADTSHHELECSLRARGDTRGHYLSRQKCRHQYRGSWSG